jgi:DNA-dependent RNA polymerase auxiliary subunit epsilon
MIDKIKDMIDNGFILVADTTNGVYVDHIDSLDNTVAESIPGEYFIEYISTLNDDELVFCDEISEAKIAEIAEKYGVTA